MNLRIDQKMATCNMCTPLINLGLGDLMVKVVSCSDIKNKAQVESFERELNIVFNGLGPIFICAVDKSISETTLTYLINYRRILINSDGTLAISETLKNANI